MKILVVGSFSILFFVIVHFCVTKSTKSSIAPTFPVELAWGRYLMEKLAVWSCTAISVEEVAVSLATFAIVGTIVIVIQIFIIVIIVSRVVVEIFTLLLSMLI